VRRNYEKCRIHQIQRGGVQHVNKGTKCIVTTKDGAKVVKDLERCLYRPLGIGSHRVEFEKKNTIKL
jgi:hypothetical protein